MVSKMKRAIDLLISVVCLFLLFPLMAVVCLLVYLSDRGNIFFTQTRVGLDGRNFRLFKFRTMCVDADKIGPYFTSEEDKRITKIGKFLRKTSIDELPQILNVIKGDMSVVGPRPNVPQQKSNYTESEWALRHSIKPGITGLAQASLRSEATELQRLALDIEYVQNHSICLDFKILVMTVRQVFFKGGN